jgi:hypothetical protein
MSGVLSDRTVAGSSPSVGSVTFRVSVVRQIESAARAGALFDRYAP